jgi:glucose dehydrogenase
MAMIAWGVMFLFAGLVMLGTSARAGAYYAYCALGAAAVGWLLMRCSRWALTAHGLLLLVALVWAWVNTTGNVWQTLMQAIPLLMPLAWTAVPSVREPLE